MKLSGRHDQSELKILYATETLELVSRAAHQPILAITPQLVAMFTLGFNLPELALSVDLFVLIALRHRLENPYEFP
jgi:hypothetical protein